MLSSFFQSLIFLHMSQYRTFDRFYTLTPYLGSANKDAVYSIDGDRLDQQVFAFDQGRLDHFVDGASSYITSANLEGRMRRDLAVDIGNPRQELPKNPTDKLIDTIPNLVPVQPDMSTPADYEATTTASLYQEAKKHHRQEDNMFVKGKGGGASISADKDNKTKNPGGSSETKTTADSGTYVPQRPMDQLDIFEGNAAGVEMNRLQKDEDNNYLNSVESINAF